VAAQHLCYSRLPADELHIPLSVEFPEGTIIGIAKQTLAVVVRFMSPRPCSFTGLIDFLDSEGKKYSLPITATADCCMFSNQPFIAANQGE
jgi:hypothetical protein